MARTDRAFASLKSDFHEKQKQFDKLLKRKKRSFQRSQVYNLERANTEDPVVFWNHITSLGPKSKQSIPWEVYDDDGSTLTSRQDVLKRWEIDFQGLLTAPDDRPEEQKAFDSNIIKSNRKREKELIETNDINHAINIDFSKEEVSKIVKKSEW